MRLSKSEIKPLFCVTKLLGSCALLRYYRVATPFSLCYNAFLTRCCAFFGVTTSNIGPQNAVPLFYPFEKFTYPSLEPILWRVTSGLADKLSVQSHANTKYTKQKKKVYTRARGYKAFFALNSTEHKIYPGYKC